MSLHRVFALSRSHHTRQKWAHLSWLTTLLFVLFCPSSLWAETAQSHDSILKVVREFLMEQTQHLQPSPNITLGRIDSRLHLEQCDQPLNASLAKGSRLSGRTLVNVHCDGSNSWSVFIQANIRHFITVITAAQALPRGTILQQEDIRLSQREMSGSNTAYLSTPEQAIGKKLKRNVRQGMILSPRLLETPKVIRRGDRVSIVANSGGIEVRMTGEALEDGATGEIIRVRNLSSKKEISARVTDAGTVEVSM